MPNYDDQDGIDGDSGDDDIGEDEVSGRGTILRPLYRNPRNEPQWSNPRAPRQYHSDPTIRWGDATEITIAESTQDAVSRDLLNVTLAKPQTCRVYLHGEVTQRTDENAAVWETTLELYVGNGSQQSYIRRQYNALPMPVAGVDFPIPYVPLDVSWEIPLTNIRGRVSMRGIDITVKYSLWLVPLVVNEV